MTHPRKKGQPAADCRSTQRVVRSSANARSGYLGCAALIGAAIGLLVARALTVELVRPGVWYEWPLVFVVFLGRWPRLV